FRDNRWAHRGGKIRNDAEQVVQGAGRRREDVTSDCFRDNRWAHRGGKIRNDAEQVVQGAGRRREDVTS
ncbi:hypothetical protein C5706_33315, partial [Klebsiella pneumoniae]